MVVIYNRFYKPTYLHQKPQHLYIPFCIYYNMEPAIVIARKSKVDSRAPTCNLKRPAVANKDPLEETVIGDRYFILRKIGEGGCGTVYHAIDKETGKDVAIKTMLPQLAEREDYVVKFMTEAALGRWVTHPNIARVIDLSLQASPMFFVMEYLDGETLGNFIRRNGPLTWQRARDILIPVCGALAAVHDDGYIHRDVKPDNIFILVDGTVKLLDLGLVMHMQDVAINEGVCWGTPEYMAPEHIAGGEIDYRADVYGLGATTYEMLTGKLPFDGKVIDRIFRDHIYETPDPPSFRKKDLPQEADLVVLRALAKDPDHRFQSVHEFEQALQAA